MPAPRPSRGGASPGEAPSPSPAAAGAPDRREREGFVLAALCALCGAFVPAVARITSTSAAATPLVVATATCLLGAGLAGLILAAHGELGRLADPRLGVRLLLLALLGTVLPFWLLYAGASRVSAIETALCLASEPVFAFLGSWLVLGHRPTPRRALALGALVAGLVLALRVDRLEASPGLWLVLATPLCWQLSHLMVLTRWRGATPTLLTGARYVVGGLLLGVLCVLRGEAAGLVAALREVGPALVLQGMGLGVLGTLAWYGAIARLDLTRTTAVVVPSIPVLSLAASFVLLGELATSRQWAGLALTVSGIAAFATAPDVRGEEEPLPPGAV